MTFGRKPPPPKPPAVQGTPTAVGLRAADHGMWAVVTFTVRDGVVASETVSEPVPLGFAVLGLERATRDLVDGVRAALNARGRR